MKVYQVVDNWNWHTGNTISDYEDHETGEKTLGIFVSKKLASEYIKQYKLQDDKQLHADERIIKDRYFISFGDKIDRVIELYDGWMTSHHRITIVEQDVIEKLE